MRVAFQGEAGAYSEEAGFGYFDAPEMVPEESFDAVFAAVASGACQSGLIPIENSLAGSIHQNYDLLLRHDLHIVGEYFLRVRHCLIGFPDVTLTEIKRVISHPQALGQCAGIPARVGRQDRAGLRHGWRRQDAQRERRADHGGHRLEAGGGDL